ncbi:Eco57I restriction-modification methylase domain-containing protein [Salibacterium lacus]|uniref:site-specific DNA-methyltransferase (adenine-specific) n=1 Tax=Salibacterium lacus TaxID=1898109 RepID=A0ABW5T5Q6_9BACI
MNKLNELIKDFKRNTNSEVINIEDVTEETVRFYINKMLEIFGWDVGSTNQIVQEKHLDNSQKEKLKLIDSTHTKPDYKMVNGKVTKAFLDAKDLNADLIHDKEVAFQVKSYGYSSDLPCSFATNFREFVVYDCRFEPNINQEANIGAEFLSLEDYINNFDFLYQLLDKNSIYNGSLMQLYDKQGFEGSNTLDNKFMQILSNFRFELASNLLTNNPELGNDKDYGDLNYYAQLILDRIIFIRVAESKGIEKQGLLESYLEKGFWVNFKSSCYADFYEHYDGAMFEKDKIFQRLHVDDYIFNQYIEKLYYPSPYKFDVIPVTLIAEIYERFLSTKIEVVNGEVKEIYKDLYQKTNGGISTPKYLVNYIVKKTLDLNSVTSAKELLDNKILEPACGSGTFLVSAFNLLESKLVELFNNNSIESEYLSWFVNDLNGTYLKVDAKREIMKNCLYGLDIDETALEVTKMTLALKIIDNNPLPLLEEVGVLGEKILKEIDLNMVDGNALVENDFFDLDDIPEEELYKTKPLEIKYFFKDVFDKGGFNYIIGNPPYVEPKHLVNLYPHMYHYIKNKYFVGDGKTDLSIYFIARSINFLREHGKLGFIMQKRFFKTEYGKKIRETLADNNFLEEIVDFKSTAIFKDRATYIAYLKVNKSVNEEVTYSYFLPNKRLDVQRGLEKDELYEAAMKKTTINAETLKERTWSYDTFLLANIKERLKNIGNIEFGNIPGIEINTGIQPLWKKMYVLKDCKVSNGILFGTNGFNESVEIEESLMRKVILNENFYCFKILNPDTYLFFPYKGQSNNDLLSISELANNYRCAYEYLMKNEKLIKDNRQYINDPEQWHGFKRIQNHHLFNKDKIMVPMTARDTFASYVNGNEFADNANIWQILIEGESVDFKKAVACIINSNSFSAMAKIEANPQQNDNYKFNKQFLVPTLFPYYNLKNSGNTQLLSDLHDQIKNLQGKYHQESVRERRVTYSRLTRLWEKLDNITNELYGLESNEVEFLSNYSRVNRVDLLYR